jgi:aryl-alcohol dehydrogenase-like predicted oxidoreductase
MSSSTQIIRGLWQLSTSHPHASNISAAPLGLDPVGQIVPLLIETINGGLTTFDCADIYSGTEEALGQVRSHFKQAKKMSVHTKFVPDLDALKTINYTQTEAYIDRSLKRLNTDQLDLCQFHWWDYTIDRWPEVLSFLGELHKRGKIEKIGLTNFNTQQLKAAIDTGIPIASIQAQVSLVDKRTIRALGPLCKTHGIKIFGYGTLLGGFMHERWLNQPEPTIDSLPNRSLVKYKLIIEDWGGWERFQSLLSLLYKIGKNSNMTPGQVAIESVLQADLASAVIVGLSPQNYHQQNQQLLSLRPLKSQDMDTLLSFECPLQGDVYDLERQARHGAIMRKNLNKT